ncbi:molybdopterin-synthase adenylyltransferase MoeB [bacterium AH-315-M05]|nr:molybdopterin-synthase adenylyltransferase MoeB [bacterium AH-315-M05]
MLSKEELKRYSRHVILPEIGIKGQETLKQAKVLVIGAGGLGCPVLQYLTAAGVGTIGIIDFDVVDETNLQRQILFDVKDVGKSKVEVAKQKLSGQNPYINFNLYYTKLTKDNALNIFKDYDIIVDGSDNFPTRYLVNDACVIVGKPLIFGSIFKFEGQVSVFNYNGGPTYRCLFPQPPRLQDASNCSEIGVLGVLPGIIGCLQANETIKIIAGIGEPLSGKLLIFDALTLNTNILEFSPIEGNFNIKELIDYDNFCGTGGEVKEITVSELKKKLDDREDIQIIDVREEFEYEICNLGGELLPLNSISNKIDTISKDKPVIVHCHHGGRSAQAINILKEKFEFDNLLNLKGGIHAWAVEIDKSMATY